MKKLIVACSLAMLTLSACNLHSVKGDGHVITRNFNQKGFRDIDASSQLEVRLIQGSEYKISIEAEENIIDLLDVQVSGDKLKIGPKNNVSFSPSHPIRVSITAPEFHDIEGSGACLFSSQGKLSSTADMKIDLSGACKTQLEIDAPKIDVEASGASDIQLRGRTRDFTVDASGASSIDCFDLMTENTRLDISGGGNAKVYASQTLDVSISGAGDVAYKGKPANIKKDISGAGSISQAN